MRVLSRHLLPPAPAIVFVLGALGLAQQPGPNVNVLPSYGSPTNTDPLRGDGYLQRQVEPVIAASSRNPDHLLAAFGDYRTVDLAGGTPGTSADGWIGISRSYDRGRTWFGSMVPGFPQDTSVVGMKSPLFGLSAGSDATLAPSTNGRFYLGALFFNRGGISNIGVVRYQDIPDTEGGDTIDYQGAVIVDKGSVSDSGNFNDKPASVADIPRRSSDAGACGGVYIAYTIFNGGESASGFKSKLGFSRSKEGKCGVAWDQPQYLNKTYPQNQGAAIAIDPRNGKIYVVWRHIKTPPGVTPAYPDALLMVTSADFGATFSNPVVITQSPVFVPFDQPTISSSQGPPTFRTNAFPSLAVDGSGNVYVAIQERVGPGGSPRIVIRTLKNSKGATWTAGSVVEAADNDAHQVMPVLDFAAGQLRLMWYDFRAASKQFCSACANGAGLDSTTHFISGFDRQMNPRLAQSTGGWDGYGNPAFGASVQVSQYLIDVNTGEVPDVPGTNPPGQFPAVNRPNLPMYSGGYVPFASDYIGLMSAARFVRTAPGSALPWRWAMETTDYSARSSFGVWYDTRDVVFPSNNLVGDWWSYSPPGTGAASCVNPGSRNGNTYFSEIRPGIVVGSPVMSRQLVDKNGAPIQRAFPIYVENPNAGPDSKFFYLTINAPGLIASFDQVDDSKNSAHVEILPFSSTTGGVYVRCQGSCSSAFAPFSVLAQETDKDGNVITGGLTGSITFNADPKSPTVTNSGLDTTETHTAHVSDPQWSNPQWANPQWANPQWANPQWSNPQWANPQWANPQWANSAPVGDFTWTVTNIGNNTSAYSSVTNVFNPDPQYTYQLILSRTYKTPGAGGASGCESVQTSQDQVISLIPNPQWANPQWANPQWANPQWANPQWSNATFYAAPVSGAPASSATAAMAASSTASPSTLPDGTIGAPRAPDEVKITLRVSKAWDRISPAPLPMTESEQTAFLSSISQVVFQQAADTGQTAPPPGVSNKGFTTTTITSVSPSPATVGQPYTVTFSVTANAPGSPAPAGNVTVGDGTGASCSTTLPATSCQLTSVTAGTKTLTTTYAGDPAFNGSVSPGVSLLVLGIDFEVYPGPNPPAGTQACSSCPVSNEFASRGVVFSFASSISGAQLLLGDSSWADPVGNPPNHSVWSSYLGVLSMTFAGPPTTVSFQLRVNNGTPAADTLITVYDTSGNVIINPQIQITNVWTYLTPGNNTFRNQTVTITNAAGISKIDWNQNAGYVAVIDNLLISPSLASLISCSYPSGSFGVGGDFIDRGFYVPSFPGSTLNQVDLRFSTVTAGTYTLSLTARANTYDGPVIGTSTSTVALTDATTFVPAAFVFSPPPTVTSGNIVTFMIAGVSGPAPAVSNVYYAVPSDFPGDSGCPVIQTDGTSPPLDTSRRNGVDVTIY